MNASTSERIRTFCRLKPANASTDSFVQSVSSSRMLNQDSAVRYEILNNKQTSVSSKILRIHQPYLVASPTYNSTADFGFHTIFGEEATQDELYDSVGKPVVDVFLSGISSCICCYGQTGTGKTWTMSGGETYASRGLIQRSLEGIFSKLSSKAVTLLISYMEIYNEVAYDLLGVSEVSSDIESFPRVTLQEGESGALHMRNLSLHAVTTVEEAIDLFLFGNMNRVVSSTAMNDASSRSHCIFTVHLEDTRHDSGRSIIRTSKLHLVDLAGSERVWKTRLNHTDLTEAKHINKSLHFLEQVMLSLYNKRSHIPYRNSVLTSVLRDALGGNCKTVLVGNISTDSANYKETIATCRFLQRCAKIDVVVPTTTERFDWKDYAGKLETENSKLRDTHLGFPHKPEGKFAFEFDENPTTGTTLRDLQEQCGSNLSLFPKEYRKRLIERVRAEGMDCRVTCIGDLCAIIQVLVAKLTQSDGEKKELRDRLKSIVEPTPVGVVTINLSDTQWKRSTAETD